MQLLMAIFLMVMMMTSIQVGGRLMLFLKIIKVFMMMSILSIQMVLTLTRPMVMFMVKHLI